MEQNDGILYELSIKAQADGNITVKVLPEEVQVSLGDLLLVVEYARDMIMQQLYMSQPRTTEDEVRL